MKILDRPEMRKLFLDTLREKGTMRAACEVCGFSRRTVEFYRRDNPEFEVEYNEAKESYYDALEEEAHRRAYEGRDKPVYYQGKVVGIIKEQSDQLMMFLLTGGRPDKYAKTKQEITGKDGAALIPAADNIEIARRLAYILTQAASAKAATDAAALVGEPKPESEEKIIH